MAQAPTPSANARKTKSASKRTAKLGDTAADRARSAVKAMEANPLSVLVGGLAVGLVAGALIPRSTREKEALAPVGKRIADGAKAAAAAAKETGKEQFSAAFISKDTVIESAKKVFESAAGAAKAR